MMLGFTLVQIVFAVVAFVVWKFRDRKDGLPGLKAQYGIVFKDDQQLAIGLRALLHTIHRRARVTLLVLVTEIFATRSPEKAGTELRYGVEVDRIVLRALQRDPDQRYQTAGELAHRGAEGLGPIRRGLRQQLRSDHRELLASAPELEVSRA